MIKKTKISWTDYTYNPWQGCRKVGVGCKNCYMFRDKKRYGQNGNYVHRSSKATFEKPLHIKEPALVFTCSWSDFFIEEADLWRWEAIKIMRLTPHIIYQVLSKRIERCKETFPDNVWLGMSASIQPELNRYNELLRLKETKKVKTIFLSLEPLLDNLTIPIEVDKPDWVIIGCESGPNRRPMRIEWAESLVEQCKERNIPIFVKQMEIDGKVTDDINLFPEHLRIQEFPEIKTN